MTDAIDSTEADRQAELALAGLAEHLDTALAWYDGAFGLETRRETDNEWIYHWQSVEYLATGDIFVQQLVGPIVIPKDGSGRWIMETWGTEDEQLDRYHRRGEWARES